MVAALIAATISAPAKKDAPNAASRSRAKEVDLERSDSARCAAWTIDWGDGSALTTAAGLTGTAAHAFSNVWATEIRVSASDGDDGYYAQPIFVLVTKPTLNVSGATAVNEGWTYTLTLDASSGISSWTVDWGDGTTPTEVGTPTGTPTHVFAGVSDSTIYVFGHDGSGNSWLASPIPVSITRKFSIDGNAAVDEQSEYTFWLGTTSAVRGTMSAWTIDWGDGSSSAPLATDASTTHTYADDNPFGYLITASASDADGPFSADPFYVLVNNVAPAVTATGGPSVDEGGVYTLNLSATADPGPDTLSSWEIDWGDGSDPDEDGTAGQIITTAERQLEVTHAFNGLAGQRTIYGRAYDEDGGYDAEALTITINNLPPVPTISGDGSVNEGSVYTLNLAASDPGQDPIAKWVIDWGDNSSETIYGNPSSADHVYSQHGEPTIRATAYDVDDWMSGTTVQKTVTVNDVAATASISGAAEFDVRDYYVLRLKANDAGSEAQSSWVVDWGDGATDSVTADNGSEKIVEHRYPGNAAASYTIAVRAAGGTEVLDSVSVQRDQPVARLYRIAIGTDRHFPPSIGQYNPPYNPDPSAWLWIQDGENRRQDTPDFILFDPGQKSVEQLLKDLIQGYADDAQFPADADSRFMIDIDYNPDALSYSGTITYNHPAETNDPPHVWPIGFEPLYVSIMATDAQGGTSGHYGPDHLTEGDPLPPELGFMVTVGTGDYVLPWALTVNLDLSGDAEHGTDYTMPKSVTIPALQMRTWVRFRIINDNEPEWTENVVATLAEGQPFLTGGAGTLPIKDEDLSLGVPGGILQADFDDDNQNNVLDYHDPFFKPHDDLYTVSLKVPKNRKAGTSVTLTAPGNMVRIWNEGGELLIGEDKPFGERDSYTWDDKKQVPDKVLMEVIAGSGSEKDIVVTLSTSDHEKVLKPERTAVGVKLWWRRPYVEGPFQTVSMEAGAQVDDVLIGHYINPRVEVQAPEAWKQGATYLWGQPAGNIFDSYQIAANKASGYVRRFDCASLVKDSIHFIWADKGENRQITVTVTLAGQTITRTTAVDVLGPYSLVEAVPGTPGFNNNRPPTAIGLFNEIGGKPGITFKGSVQVPLGFRKASGGLCNWRFLTDTRPWRGPRGSDFNPQRGVTTNLTGARALMASIHTPVARTIPTILGQIPGIPGQNLIEPTILRGCPSSGTTARSP